MIVIKIIIVAVLMVAILRNIGRIWWCKCGKWNPWTWKVIHSCNSQHLLDLYSLTHINHGIVLYYVTSNIFEALVFEALWEILENTPKVIESYRAKTISIGYTGDSISNSCGDLVCCILGYYFGSIWVLIALELGLAYVIRDNLILNVIMLLYPIKLIQQWQQRTTV